jgi:phosphomannomutase
MKQLIGFDLDGTLAPSKSSIDTEMAGLLRDLLSRTQVAIISGGDFPQFQKQVVGQLAAGSDLSKLTLLPTCGTKFFIWKNNGWDKLYSEDLSPDQKTLIEKSLNDAVEKSGFKAEKTWGPAIEDRGTQITYSALGQQAPLDAKKTWDPDFSKRKKIAELAQPALKDFSVRLGGETSIDVTLPGIDKAYGIYKLRDVLKIPIEAMLYVGDALFPGGNDYPARSTGVDCVAVRDPEDTKSVIQTAIAYLG